MSDNAHRQCLMNKQYRFLFSAAQGAHAGERGVYTNSRRHRDRILLLSWFCEICRYRRIGTCRLYSTRPLQKRSLLIGISWLLTSLGRVRCSMVMVFQSKNEYQTQVPHDIGGMLPYFRCRQEGVTLSRCLVQCYSC